MPPMHSPAPEYPKRVLAVAPDLPPKASREACVAQRQVGGVEPSLAVQRAQGLLAGGHQVLVIAAAAAAAGGRGGGVAL